MVIQNTTVSTQSISWCNLLLSNSTPSRVEFSRNEAKVNRSLPDFFFPVSCGHEVIRVGVQVRTHTPKLPKKQECCLAYGAVDNRQHEKCKRNSRVY